MPIWNGTIHSWKSMLTGRFKVIRCFWWVFTRVWGTTRKQQQWRRRRYGSHCEILKNQTDVSQLNKHRAPHTLSKHIKFLMEWLFSPSIAIKGCHHVESRWCNKIKKFYNIESIASSQWKGLSQSQLKVTNLKKFILSLHHIIFTIIN